MPQLVTDTDEFFEPWLGSFAGNFLIPNPNAPTQPVVDTEQLIVHIMRCSTGEQVAAACWWNVVMQAPAPWCAEPFTKLHQMDMFHVERVVSRLMAGVPRRLDPRTTWGPPNEGASNP